MWRITNALVCVDPLQADIIGSLVAGRIISASFLGATRCKVTRAVRLLLCFCVCHGERRVVCEVVSDVGENPSKSKETCSKSQRSKTADSDTKRDKAQVSSCQQLTARARAGESHKTGWKKLGRKEILFSLYFFSRGVQPSPVGMSRVLHDT